MSITTTFQLDEADEQLLKRLAAEYGGNTSAIRQALRFLAADLERRDALGAFLEAWTNGEGPVDEEAVAAMAKRYGL